MRKAQLLGRLPWFALFFLRAFFLRDFFAMSTKARATDVGPTSGVGVVR